ncbi:helix-turn-helix domain-containing protein [Actinoplanes solisilvae]|uniref:helix-turn-helix domain-containing protein n=1 Tax=Actinoplanes solisilvae TaxID=2486853 RepID=UPI000FDB06D6|nr:helix-turn-helix transcriptional regulator [Actinoplanes solisilvae]
MVVRNALGEYLRSRRELIRPEEVGLPAGRRRKVAGLRREELALLAGISADYYLRLEQGRDRHPSGQVLDALARALRLDDDGVAHLHKLAAARPSRPAGRARRAPAGMARLIDQLPMPAFLQDRYGEVLAANAPARALSPHYHPEVNLIRAVFLEPEDRSLRPDWDRATREAVSGLRAMSADDLEDPVLAGLVEELSAGSSRFRELWARYDVRQRVGGISLFEHPRVGPLRLRHEKLLVAGGDGLTLVLYHADPDSDSAAALANL